MLHLYGNPLTQYCVLVKFEIIRIIPYVFVGYYNYLWAVVIVGIIMLLVIGFFLIHLLRTCVPRVPDNFFIFNEDEDNKLILATQYRPVRQFGTVIAQKVRQPEAQKSSSIRFKPTYMPVSVSQAKTSDVGSHKDQKYESFDDEEEIKLITYHKEPEFEVIKDDVEPTKLDASEKRPRFDTEVTNISVDFKNVSYETEERYPRSTQSAERSHRPKLKNKGPADSLTLKKPKS